MTRDFIFEQIQEKVINIWNLASTQSVSIKEWFQCNLEKYSEEDKRENELLLNEFIGNINKKTIDFDSFIYKEKILFAKDYLGEQLYKEYFNNVASFYSSIRSIEPQFDLPQLWQIISNYLVYAIILAMLDKEQQCNESIKAFCLLYPYTDNYIDSKDNSSAEKARFNDMIYSALNNHLPLYEDKLSKKICDCLKVCQNYLNGSKKELITSALLLMLDSQKDSSLLDGMTTAQYDDNYNSLVDILAYKGGMTILIDYIFAETEDELTELQFFLQLGMILQLADDLLDINDDVINNSPTLFSLVPDVETREANICRLMHYTIHVFSKHDSQNTKIHVFMLRTIMILFGFAVMRNQQYFSEEFKDNICQFMPFSKEYLLKINNELSKVADSSNNDMEKNMKQIDSIVDLLKVHLE